MHHHVLDEMADSIGLEKILTMLTEVKENDADIAELMGLEGDPSGIRSAEANREMDYWIPRLREFLKQNRPAQKAA